jgi:PadR family transcriptional regulator PadR
MFVYRSYAAGGSMKQVGIVLLGFITAADAHGHAISKIIERTSENFWELEEGTLYPALYRLEDRGWISSYWGTTENNRRAKYYRLTAVGRKRLKHEVNRWRQMARAIALVMGDKVSVEGPDE